jgi:hypothetical protein
MPMMHLLAIEIQGAVRHMRARRSVLRSSLSGSTPRIFAAMKLPVKLQKAWGPIT